jgi:hypothetical protein
VVGLNPCSYDVDFVPVPGFLKPNQTNVTLVYGQTNVVNATYTPMLSLNLHRDTGLALSGPIGTTWRVEFKPGLEAGHEWSNLTTAILSNSPQWVPGTRPTSTANRFYRSVLVE